MEDDRLAVDAGRDRLFRIDLECRRGPLAPRALRGVAFLAATGG